jgi:hypothetical protein
MTNISALMSAIYANIKETLPAILEEAGLTSLEYNVGFPPEQNKLFCSVRYAETSFTVDAEKITFVIHLQLNGLLEEDAYKYIDAVKKYIDVLDLENFFIDSVLDKITDGNFHSGGVNSLFDVTLTRPVDDCGQHTYNVCA